VACVLVVILEPSYRPHAKQLLFLHNPLVTFAALTVIASIIVTSTNSCTGLPPACKAYQQGS
jgi:hypothetical protein